MAAELQATAAQLADARQQGAAHQAQLAVQQEKHRNAAAFEQKIRRRLADLDALSASITAGIEGDKARQAQLQGQAAVLRERVGQLRAEAEELGTQVAVSKLAVLAAEAQLLKAQQGHTLSRQEALSSARRAQHEARLVFEHEKELDKARGEVARLRATVLALRQAGRGASRGKQGAAKAVR